MSDSLNDSLDEYLHLLLFVGVLRAIGLPNRLIGDFPLDVSYLEPCQHKMANSKWF